MAYFDPDGSGNVANPIRRRRTAEHAQQGFRAQEQNVLAYRLLPQQAHRISVEALHAHLPEKHMQHIGAE